MPSCFWRSFGVVFWCSYFRIVFPFNYTIIWIPLNRFIIPTFRVNDTLKVRIRQPIIVHIGDDCEEGGGIGPEEGGLVFRERSKGSRAVYKTIHFFNLTIRIALRLVVIITVCVSFWETSHRFLPTSFHGMRPRCGRN